MMFFIHGNINQGSGSNKLRKDQMTKEFFLWPFFIALLVIQTPTKAASSPSHPTFSTSIASACKNTLYQDACQSSLFSMAASVSKTPVDLFDLSVQFAIERAHSSRLTAYALNLLNKNRGTYKLSGIDDCIDLLDASQAQLSDVIDVQKARTSDDVRTWLSAALTYQTTCLESLNTVESLPERELMEAKARNLTQYISNSLALYQSLGGKSSHTKAKSGGRKSGGRKSGGRRLLSDEFPAWVSAGDRKLLEASPEEMEGRLVVAKDGSGTHATIHEAILAAAAAAPSGGRTVIHVTAGTYRESLRIPSGQKNVLLVGEGKGITVITGNKNVADGSTTYRSATFATTGDGFMARDITFQNNAGPAKHQAVALLVKADKSVFYRCSIVGYQDTLYTLSNRQFYRDTDIYGTVDFIFGNSAVVFQNCNINSRKSGSNNKNYITAQGRSDPNQNTGISIHNCRIQAASDLDPKQHSTFLGRPWKKYSRTVVMQSFIDGSVTPAGWGEWSGSFALGTLYYGEYMNSGPGSGTGGRVRWPGYRAAITPAEATKFTVAAFIFGNSWLPSTGVQFDSGLHA